MKRLTILCASLITVMLPGSAALATFEAPAPLYQLR